MDYLTNIRRDDGFTVVETTTTPLIGETLATKNHKMTEADRAACLAGVIQTIKHAVLMMILFEKCGIRIGHRFLRYLLEDAYGTIFPHTMSPQLIPMSAKAAIVVSKIKGEMSWNKRTKINDLAENAPDPEAEALAYEHVVPLSVLTGMLVKTKGCEKEIERILGTYFQIFWITKKEDRKLNRLGLRSKMPDGWKDGDSAYARYHAAHIETL